MLAPETLIEVMLFLMFLVGMLSFISGIIVLFYRSASPDVKSISAHTAQLAKKGLAEDVAGLVGNATQLIDAMDQLVRTMRGVGILLTGVGVLLMLASSWLSLKFYMLRV